MMPCDPIFWENPSSQLLFGVILHMLSVPMCVVNDTVSLSTDLRGLKPKNLKTSNATLGLEALGDQECITLGERVSATETS